MPKLLSPQGRATLVMFRQALGITTRSGLLEVIQDQAGGGNLTMAIRGFHKFMDRIGLGECQEWIGFFDDPPIGYDLEEWRKKWSNPRHYPVCNHSWPNDESLDRLGDKLGLPKELPSPRGSLKRPFRDDEDEDALRSQAAAFLKTASATDLKDFLSLGNKRRKL